MNSGSSVFDKLLCIHCNGRCLLQIFPYILVLIGGIAGINVFVVLLIGIVSGSLIMLISGATAATDLLANMGSGAAGMFETTMVAILVSALCALVREHGGFDALLYFIRKVFKGNKGGQLGMGLLVGIIPYGAQMLVAIAAAANLGSDVGAFQILPFLLYPYMLLISSLVFIIFINKKKA